MLDLVPKSQDFVTIAANGDMLEIAASRLALSKSDDAKTKAFAEKMIEDHTRTSSELKSVVASGTVQVALPQTMDQPHQEKLDQLGKLEGQDFTRRYDQMQLAVHKEAVALFQRYAEGGDNPALKEFASTTLPHLQEHLKLARRLAR
jgi:putative membrane protein